MIFYVARSKIHGYGLFTRVAIPKNARIDRAEMPRMKKHGMNHSCSPNMSAPVRHQLLVKGKWVWRIHRTALRNIAAREELTVRYKNGVAHCRCGACEHGR